MRAYGVQNRLDAQKHPPDMGGVWVRAVFWEDQGRGKSTTGQYVSANKHFSWAKSGRRISIQASPDGFPERWPIQCFFLTNLVIYTGHDRANPIKSAINKIYCLITAQPISTEIQTIFRGHLSQFDTIQILSFWIVSAVLHQPRNLL